MSEIYGTPEMSSEQRESIFNNWYAENKGTVTDGEMGFLRFFFDLQQSFISHINPLAGGSTEQVESSLDKTRAQTFFTTMSEKVQEYVHAHPEQDKLWTAWVNPAAIVKPELNTDPLDDNGVKKIYDKLAQEMDKVVGLSLGSKSVTRGRFKKYKSEMEDYESQVEEESRSERDAEKKLRQQQSNDKAIQEKLAARARTERAQSDRTASKVEKNKPVYAQKTRSAMANKISIRANPNKASVPVAARALVRRQPTVTRAAAPDVAGTASRVAASAKKRRPMAFAAKPLSARSSKILSATVSKLFKGRASKTNSSGKFVKRQPKSKMSVS